jgi:hypothetical protein
MANIFVLDNCQDFSENLNIDELYEKKRQMDLNKLELFRKILNRIHVKIKTTAKTNKYEKFCWFIVPEIIIGVPKYDQAGCIAYILNTLENNGFMVRYFHPNTILISWEHWIPTYVRNEIKKKTGIEVNSFGEKIKDKKQEEEESVEEIVMNNTNTIQQIKNSKKYTPINTYKPSGSFVYSDDLLDKIDRKMN